MIPIDSKICSFLTAFSGTTGDFSTAMKYCSVQDVRQHEGYHVTSFHDLVALTALIALRNRRYDIFFRGQANDYKDGNGRTVIYPTICRPPKGEHSIYTSIIRERYKKLCELTEHLRGLQYRERFDEYYYALIQHYELMPTPMIDVTQSLRVAATFALRAGTIGFLYVLGLPYPQGSISHFIDHNMAVVKLASVCPANACRPRYQEGFLVGRLPFMPAKEPGDNLANRLLAKLVLSNASGTFWDRSFMPLPDSLLFPVEDVYRKWLDKLYWQFSSAYLFHSSRRTNE